MGAAGKVCTGFSKPYVAKYSNTGGVVSYSGCMPLARGVKVSLSIDTTKVDPFFADNVSAETAEEKFVSGTLTLTVDGLLTAAEKFIMGTPDPTTVEVGSKQVGVTHYGDEMQIPYIGVGFLVRYQSAGVVTYAPMVLTKSRFQQLATEAETQGETISWQTQELTAKLSRDDTAQHNWKLVGEDQATEEDAEAVLQALLGGAA